MLAQVIHEKGPPENFVWEDVALDAPGEGEVNLRNLAIGVNFADIYHRSGMPHPLVVGPPPIIVGLEAVATVVAVGIGVTSCKPGDKVCHCTPPIGSYAEEQIYPADQLIGVPDGLGLSDAEIASLLLKGLTARFLLRETYRVQPAIVLIP